MSFEIRYAVPMHCDSCADSVASALRGINGIEDFDIDLKGQNITARGSAPPSSVVDAMKTIGKDAFVRGTGLPNSSAVCILEDPITGHVGGLARLIAASENQTLIDITTQPPALGHASVHTLGDISCGAASTGSPLFPLGLLKHGRSFTTHDIALSSLIGRSVVVDSPELVGVIARSAGLWENSKTVCSCSGQTLWQERTAVESKY